AFCVFFGSTLDGSFYTVLRHVYCFRVLNSSTQSGVVFRVRAAFFYCNSNFFSKTCELDSHFGPAFKFSFFSKFESSTHFIIILISDSITCPLSSLSDQKLVSNPNLVLLRHR